MKYQLPKAVKSLSVLLLTIFIILTGACKKQIIEVPVDAFDQVNPELKYVQGAYKIEFSLHQYPYKEVGIKLTTNKSSLYQNKDIVRYTANEVSLNRYGVFLNNMAASKTYYYQIYVKDAASSKEVYSDVYSFITTP
ncbi:hypothetical protein ACS5PU_12220 [Pedobacter sp. GSP4]|uniref:hypothetical protein n=1 Tax=Pedobacter sp. GSP4 TaxID=3453716 RepID=UPI003EE9B071